jgi:hypothetical protein
MRPIQVLSNVIFRLLGRSLTDLWVGASAQSLRNPCAHLDPRFSLRQMQVLRIGIRNHEIDACDTAFDHVVDRIAPRAADAKDDNTRGQISGFRWDGRFIHFRPIESVMAQLPQRPNSGGVAFSAGRIERAWRIAYPAKEHIWGRKAPQTRSHLPHYG